ncbi:alpha/beta hydrolase [Halioglobus maricola]|nr:alpha/beta fold hydrolase [Halioglobus maricola]
MLSPKVPCQIVAPLIALLLAVATPAYSNEPSINEESITFWSGGAQLRGSVFKPQGLQPEEKLPGILLIHGWGGNRSNLNRSFAPNFASKGFVVMTFDLRSWGESEGFLLNTGEIPVAEEANEVSLKAQHLRSIVNPAKMIEDSRAALSWFVAEPNLQADNIGVWGTSLGGGLALVTAANDKRIKAVVTQVGAVNNKANFLMIPDKMVAEWETQRARGKIAPYPGPESAIPGFKGYPDMIAIKQYDPAAYWQDLNVPTLIIDAEDEELFDRRVNGMALHESLEGRVENQYLVLPGKHYDIYRDEGYRQALTAAQNWFLKYLKK